MQLGFLSGKSVDIDDKVGDVLTQPLHIQFAVAIDIRLAKFQKTSKRREAFQTLRDKAARQKIEHDVHAASARDLHHLVVKVEGTRIENVLDSHLPHEVALFLGSRRSDHRRASALGELNRRAADTTGS